MLKPLCLLSLLLVGCSLKQPESPPLSVDSRPQPSCTYPHNDAGYRSVQAEFVVQADGKIDPSSVRIVDDMRQPNQDRIGVAALPNVQRFLEDCTFQPATIAGEPVDYTHKMWVRVSDKG